MIKKSLLRKEIEDLQKRQRMLAALAPFFRDGHDPDRVQEWIDERVAVEIKLEALLAKLEAVSSIVTSLESVQEMEIFV